MKWIYTKFLKENADPFFYIKSLQKNGDKECVLCIEAPIDDFPIEIKILNGLDALYTKNARLKPGINKVELSIEPSLLSSQYTLQVKSSSQCVEREFKELSV